MNPEKAWAILTARGGAMVSAGRGGKPVFPPHEIARCLAGLARGPFLMGMVRETQDFVSLAELEERLSDEIHDFAVEDSWPLRGMELFWRCRNFAALAVLEILVPRPNACAACNGSGWIANGAMLLACTKCLTVGARMLSAHMRAELMEISWPRWHEAWAMRYERAFCIASGWQSEAISHLARNLKSLENSSS